LTVQKLIVIELVIMQEASINEHDVKEMHRHMVTMEEAITSLHEHVEKSSARWRRRNRDLPDPELGATLPMGLVIPVTMDCFVDGFLIGVSVALCPSAGIILGFANCLEMSFLGMAYSVRLKKCTGSTALVRAVALTAPPLLMFLAAGLGAWLAAVAHDLPFVFIAFVAFGVVALISLACGELVIEAREAQGTEELWYVSLVLYLGIYLVLMIANVL
jgi:zinc transporter ZupT